MELKCEVLQTESIENSRKHESPEIAMFENKCMPRAMSEPQAYISGKLRNFYVFFI